MVLPTYNERENVARLLAAVRASLPDSDVLVVDDNSPDDTASLVYTTKLKARKGNQRIVVNLRDRVSGKMGTARADVRVE